MAKEFIQRGYSIVSGGTDNHMFLINLLDKDFSGKEAEEVLGHANITVNKNTVPGEKRSPQQTSGIRIGSPAMTTRGFKENEAKQVAHWISDILDDIHNESIVSRIKTAAADLCKRFPVY